MPRFNANLSMMFNEVPFLDRFAAAAKAGFSAVEFLFPYDFPKEQVKEALDRAKLKLILHNMPPGDWAKGERGMAILPGREAEFRAGVAKAIDYATHLGCPQIHCMAGLVPAGVPQAAMRETYVANLKYAAAETAKAGLRLLIEPINPRDIPGYYLNTSKQGIEIMDAVGAPNLFLQYDIYHMQIVEGDLAPTMERLLPRIGHMQLADTPGRHEPGTGEINYPFLFGHLDRIGYQGWIGCEYRPAGDTVAGLGWARDYLAASR
jgi:hydroxypyruvate isomerase